MSQPLPPAAAWQRKPLVLLGMMAAGKSSVGAALATLLQRPHLDTDARLLQDAQVSSVAALWTQLGANGFRAREAALLQALLARQPLVVLSCGGGTPLNFVNRQLLQQHAYCIYLYVSRSVLLQRLAAASQWRQRPQLAAAAPRAWQDVAQRLWLARQVFYNWAPLQIDTSQRSVAQVAQLIVQRLQQARRAKLATTRARLHSSIERQPTYTVCLSHTPLPWQAYVQACCRRRDVLLLSDAKLRTRHAQLALQICQAAALPAGKRCRLYCLPGGEGSKRLAVAAQIYNFLLRHGYGRQTLLLAVGGGVVGDVGGFVASTYMRGIAWMQLPTTTLAAVDSSIGAKNALNSRRAKNSIGTFYPPQAVLIALSWLSTQPAAVHAAGWVEVLKIAATCDAAFWQQLQITACQRVTAALRPLLWRALQLKAAIVAADVFETQRRGGRAVLNFGHTLGHAFEHSGITPMPHGVAVGLGMLAETAWAISCGYSTPAVYNALHSALTALHLPTAWQTQRCVAAALHADKKAHNGRIRLAVVPHLGTHRFHNVPLAALTAFLQRAQTAEDLLKDHPPP